MSTTPPTGIRCRKIDDTDIASVAMLLATGFPSRNSSRWAEVLIRLGQRPVPEGFPKYGFMLESQSKPVGAVILIFTEFVSKDGSSLRCNVSTWYVAPEFRSYAALLASLAVKREPVTYINVSPAAHTFPILEAHKFSRLCEGVFFAAPALNGGFLKARVARLSEENHARKVLPAFEADLVKNHNAFGCLSISVKADGDIYPFIFKKRLTKFKGFACAQLVYCRDIDVFVRYAGPIGRYLLRHGLPIVCFGADRKVRGLIGQFHGRPMYYRGHAKPRLGDLAYTEEAIFGV